MTRILFWNIGSKPLESALGQAAHDQDADIVIVCEHGNRTATIEAELNKLDPKHLFYLVKPVLAKNESLAVFSRFREGKLTVVTEQPHCLIHALARENGDELLIASVHLPSPLHQSANDLLMLAQDSADCIRDQEAQRRHRQTIVVGDFNMDPYHPGMIASHAFHAVMDRQIALQESRQVQRKEHFYFYNPMWSRLGDTSPGPPGTYFKAKASPECHFWHVWDQVLVRPPLLSNFNSSRLTVITKIGSSSLLTGRGRPDTKKFSDHLPICFEI